MFARIFGTDDDQILAKLGEDEEHNREVRIYFQPQSVVTCEIGIKFGDGEDAQENAEKCLRGLSEVLLRPIVEKIASELKAQDAGNCGS